MSHGGSDWSVKHAPALLSQGRITTVVPIWSPLMHKRENVLTAYAGEPRTGVFWRSTRSSQLQLARVIPAGVSGFSSVAALTDPGHRRSALAVLCKDLILTTDDEARGNYLTTLHTSARGITQPLHGADTPYCVPYGTAAPSFHRPCLSATLGEQNPRLRSTLRAVETYLDLRTVALDRPNYFQ
jgi:hypothetical protein